MKKNIFFDFDGVLMNSKQVNIEIIREFFPNYTLKEFEKSFHKNVYEDEKVKYLVENHHQRFQELFVEKIRAEHFFPFAKDFLQRVSVEHNLFIISGAPTNNLEIFLDLIECRELFTEICGADVAKSKVERFEMLINKYELEKSDIIFITDSLGDILEANEVGLDSIGVTWGVHNEDILSKGNPRYVVEDFEDLEVIIDEHF